MKKNLLISTTVLFLVVLMSISAFAQDTVELDFVWFTDGNEDEVLRDIISEYQEENPNIEFNIIEIPFNDLTTRLRTMIGGGNPPDLARLGNANIGHVEAAMYDLNPHLGEDYINQFMEATHPYAMDGDRLIAVPQDVTANGIFYNKDHFEQAGVEVPSGPDDIWTWEEWADALEEVVANSDARYGLAYDFTVHRWSTLLYQAGGRFFNEEWTEMAINSPEGIRTLEFFKELHDRNIIPRSIWLGGENPNTLFRSGQTAMHWAGNWMMTNYRDTIENFDWGVTYMPKENTRSSVLGGKFLGTFKEADHKEEAADFIEFISSQEQNAKFNRESLFLSPRLDNSQLDYEFGAEYFEIFSNELANSPKAASYDWANTEVMGQIQSDIQDNIVYVIQGNKTPEEAAETIEELGNQYMD